MLEATSPLHFLPGSYKLMMPNAYSLLHILILSTPPGNTICIREPQSSAPLQKISTGSAAPSCHQRSNSSLHLGQSLLVGLSSPKAPKESRKCWRQPHPPNRQRSTCPRTPQVPKGVTRPAAVCIRCSFGGQESGLCIDPSAQVNQVPANYAHGISLIPQVSLTT